MRLLLANPNTSQAVTERIAAVARSAASAGTTIHAVTAAAGVRQAETLASLRPRKPTAGSFRRPDAKPMTGVPAPLVRLFGGLG